MVRSQKQPEERSAPTVTFTARSTSEKSGLAHTGANTLPMTGALVARTGGKPAAAHCAVAGALPALATPTSGTDRIDHQSANLNALPIGIFLAIPVRLYREGLRIALEKRMEVTVVGETDDLAVATDRIISSQAAVAVVDVAHSGGDILIRDLRARTPKLRILAFAVEERLATVLSFAEAGAHGFFSAGGSVDDLVVAVVNVAGGEMTCSPKVAGVLLAHLTNPSVHGPRHGSLTTRERDVLGLMQRGCSNKEIARFLSISGATVKNHVHHVLEKMQVKTRAQAMARFGSTGASNPVA